jgi:predicted nucleic acid-binding protein
VKSWFVDANVFLRFFVQDDDLQHRQSVRLFERAFRGEIRLLCGPPVLFEVVWTLRSAYGQTKTAVLDVLEAILAWPGIEMTDRAIVGTAVERSRQSGVEFADAYIAASSEAAGCDGVATFNDKDFVRLSVKIAVLSP